MLLSVLFTKGDNASCDQVRAILFLHHRFVRSRGRENQGPNSDIAFCYESADDNQQYQRVSHRILNVSNGNPANIIHEPLKNVIRLLVGFLAEN